MNKTQIKRDPTYIKEKGDHDRYCDGGVIYHVNRFTGRHHAVECAFCERVRRHIEKKAEATKQAELAAELSDEDLAN